MSRALVNIPKSIKKGEPFEVKIIISHPMETGYRVDDVGKPIARHIIRDFLCTYLGDEAIRVEMFPAISANPYFSFFVMAEQSGPLILAWTDDRGEGGREAIDIVVE